MNLSHSEFLRKKINERLVEVFGRQSKLIQDAEERGMIITKSRLSKYLSGNQGGLIEDQILWVATRLGINIHINFGSPIVNKKTGEVKYDVLPYSELDAIKRLNKIFKKK